MVHAVIMAGGYGERLWPLSTPERPKQFLKLFGDRSMLQQTVDRVLPLVEIERILVVTRSDHVALVHEQLPELPKENIIAEPVGRGTAPCVGLSAVVVRQKDPEAVMLVLPADHLVREEESFREVLRGATEVAYKGTNLVTLGIKPDRPELGYGYIHTPEKWRGGKVPGGVTVLEVSKFTEKPDLETAKCFLKAGTYYWNSGMFVWRADTILEEIERYMQDLHSAMRQLQSCLGKPNFEKVLEDIYAGLKAESIDRGVMEKSDRILLIPASRIGWSDAGDWAALREKLARVDKPWGYEHLWALNQNYAGKFLHIRAGKSLSLRYHEVKDETICVLHGKLRLRVGKLTTNLEDRILIPGGSCSIPPGTIHQMEALEDCVVAEVSTPHLTDVVRLGDRYGRVESSELPSVQRL